MNWWHCIRHRGESRDAVSHDRGLCYSQRHTHSPFPMGFRLKRSGTSLWRVGYTSFFTVWVHGQFGLRNLFLPLTIRNPLLTSRGSTSQWERLADILPDSTADNSCQCKCKRWSVLRRLSSNWLHSFILMLLQSYSHITQTALSFNYATWPPQRLQNHTWYKSKQSMSSYVLERLALRTTFSHIRR